MLMTITEDKRMADNKLDEMISLADLLGTLRKELDEAGRQGTGSDTKFRFDEVELELQVVTTKGGKGGGGVKFWVYNASAEVSAGEARTQRLTLKFTPVSAESGELVQVSDSATK
jgi:hypothetical protein